MHIRSLALAALGTVFMVGAASPAFADDWRWHHYHGWHGYGWGPRVYVAPVYAPPVYFAPPPVYYAPPRVYYAPPVVGYGVRLH